MEYRVKRSADYLAHAGKKGMKWGYSDGKKNGKRTAEDVVNEIADSIGYKKEYVEEVRQLGLKYGFDSTQFKSELWNLSEGDTDAAYDIRAKLEGTMSAKDKIKDKLGVDERNRMNESAKNVKKVAADKNSTKNRVNTAKAMYEHYRDDYAKTPLGQVTKAKNMLKSGSDRVSNMLVKRKKK